jgi:hypothetical protein
MRSISNTRLTRAAAVAVVSMGLVAGTAAAAFADGDVTWKNKATGYYLDANISGSSVYSGADTAYSVWLDHDLGSNVWQERPADYTADCLAGYDEHSDGTVAVNLFPCDDNDSSYDQWNEDPEQGHWELYNIGYGLALNGASGPNNNGEYSNNVFLNYYNGDAYHIWE